MVQVADGFASVLGGMNSAVKPLLLQPTEYARGINVTSRLGSLSTRPGFSFVKTLPSGKYQGGARWSLNSGDRFVFMVDGKVYDVIVDTNVQTAHPGTSFSGLVERAYFGQADKWLEVQDGVSRPNALEEVGGESMWYNENPNNTNPATVRHVIGTIMQYAHGRMHYVPAVVPDMSPALPDSPTDEEYNAIPTDVSPAVDGRTIFVSSDVRDNWDPQWLFRMSEHRVLNEGGGLSLPQEIGFITGMAALRNAATGTGVGPLIVFGREGLSAFDVGLARTQWKASEVQISQVLFTGVGTNSPYSVIPANDDILFLDTDSHLRSLRYTKSAVGSESGGLSSVPISNEMRYFIRLSPSVYLPAASVALFDNRVAFALCGEAGPQFKALGIYDLAQVYTSTGTDTPSYDGVWTGFKFQQVLSLKKNGKSCGFVVVKTSNDGNALFMVDEDALVDAGTTPIQSSVITRIMAGNDADYINATKRLQYCEFWLEDIKATTGISVYYRPSHYHKWSLLGSKTITVPSGSDPQARRSVTITLDQSEVACDPVTKEPLNTGTMFQFYIKWTGHCTIQRFMWRGETVSDAPAECDTDNEDNVLVDASSPGDYENDFEYEVIV